jgi:hypothetical protein
MDSIVIGNSRLKYIVLSIGSLGFVAGGIFLALRPTLYEQLAGWPAILFFGACAIVGIRQVADTTPRLVINESGVFDRTLGIGVIKWSDIEGAVVQSIHQNPFICLKLRNEDSYLTKLTSTGRALVAANIQLGFSAINLNLSGVDADADAICALILKRAAISQSEGR